VPTFLVAIVLVSAGTLVWFYNYDNLTAHLKYIYRNVFLMFRVNSDWITGVFESRPFKEINIPLWTLAYEAWLYVALFTISLLPRRLWVATVFIALIVLNICWLSFTVNEARIPFTPIYPMRIGRLGCFFFAGSLIAAYWHLIAPRAVLLGVLSVPLFLGACFISPPQTFIHALLLAMAIIGLGSSSAFSWFSKGGDPSYGMYVFGWPIQQFAAMLLPGLWSSMLTALVVTTGVGYATFHLYEKRFIDSRKDLAAWLRTFKFRLLRVELHHRVVGLIERAVEVVALKRPRV
jgi:peptidoglycan/LPS O-acetylase OafA/YrhL